VGCGFRLIKGSLRPAAVLVSEPVEDDPVVTFSSGFLTCSGGRVLDIGMPDCDRLTAGLGDPSIDIRDFLEDSEVLVPSLRLFVFLVPMGELVGSGEDDPRSREGLPCPFVEVSWLLLRSGVAP
jgi:hypothetical protein